MKGEWMSEGIVKGVERTHSYHGVLPALQQLAQRMSFIQALLVIIAIKISVRKVRSSAVQRALYGIVPLLSPFVPLCSMYRGTVPRYHSTCEGLGS
jgi:hypothetical protein